MRLIALMPVRNEDWCLGLSLRVLLQFCDHVVVLLHECADLSERIAQNCQRESGGRVSFTGVSGDWHEMQHRNELLEKARELRATHIWLGDADEVLSGNLLPDIRHQVKATPKQHILQLPMYNLRGGIERYHANGTWGNRVTSVAFADNKRLHWSGDRFHHREPEGHILHPHTPITQGAGGVMHLWGASERRLIARHRAYRITERLRWPRKPSAQIESLYSLATDGDAKCPARKWAYWPVPSDWWAAYAPLMGYLDVDAEPWQEAWCAAMIAQHGRDCFAGLRI